MSIVHVVIIITRVLFLANHISLRGLMVVVQVLEAKTPQAVVGIEVEDARVERNQVLSMYTSLLHKPILSHLHSLGY